jgi:hypothetical protein
MNGARTSPAPLANRRGQAHRGEAAPYAPRSALASPVVLRRNVETDELSPDDRTSIETSGHSVPALGGSQRVSRRRSGKRYDRCARRRYGGLTASGQVRTRPALAERVLSERRPREGASSAGRQYLLNAVLLPGPRPSSSVSSRSDTAFGSPFRESCEWSLTSRTWDGNKAPAGRSKNDLPRFRSRQWSSLPARCAAIDGFGRGKDWPLRPAA